MDSVKGKTKVSGYVPDYLAPLYKRGYNVSEAARLIGCTPTHLRWVLMGKRVMSAELTEKLKSLPKKQLLLRAS